MKKRIISLLVGLSMLFNMTAVLPANVFASDISEPDTKTVTEWNGHKYQIFDTSMYWKDAEEYCESLGGHLVTIIDEEEKSFVENFVSCNGKRSIYWYGATDEEEEGNWKWVTGENSSLIKKYGMFDNMSEVENYLALTGVPSGYWNDWCNNGNDGAPIGMYSFENLGFVCEWDDFQQNIQMDESMSYTVFSGSDTRPLYIFGNENRISGDVYIGSFFCSASLLNIDGKLDSVGEILIFCAKDDIKESNKFVDPIKMPDWDNRIMKAAGSYEYTEDSITKIEDKNVVNGSLVSGGNIEVSGTSFSGDCYIVSDTFDHAYDEKRTILRIVR